MVTYGERVWNGQVNELYPLGKQHPVARSLFDRREASRPEAGMRKLEAEMPGEDGGSWYLTLG
jgi:hypothetical protein